MAKVAAAVGLCALALVQAPAAAPAAPAAGKVLLAPHRAFYDLKLADSDGTRGVSNVRGRILYDFSGSACEGYVLKFRQVSDLLSSEGKDVLSDLSSTSWEDGAAKSFRFSSENKVNLKVSDRVDGRAERNASAVAVTLAKPDDKTFKVPVGVVFPTEHVRKIIAAARAGKKVLDLTVYDGSDNGEKLYNTLTVIGQPIAPGESAPDDAAAKEPAMAGLSRWPVTVSYFERDPKKQREGEETPAYSISFELYENGISRALKLSYSDFTISGQLISLDVKKPKPCK